jgi:hypothetical protein
LKRMKQWQSQWSSNQTQVVVGVKSETNKVRGMIRTGVESF